MPAENKIQRQADSHATVPPECRGGFRTRPQTRLQRTACRRPEWGQRSEMSGNENSAPNRHSPTGGNPAQPNLGPPRPPGCQTRPCAQALWLRNLRLPRRTASPGRNGGTSQRRKVCPLPHPDKAATLEPLVCNTGHAVAKWRRPRPARICGPALTPQFKRGD